MYYVKNIPPDIDSSLLGDFPSSLVELSSLTYSKNKRVILNLFMRAILELVQQKKYDGIEKAFSLFSREVLSSEKDIEKYIRKKIKIRFKTYIPPLPDSKLLLDDLNNYIYKEICNNNEIVKQFVSIYVERNEKKSFLKIKTIAVLLKDIELKPEHYIAFYNIGCIDNFEGVDEKTYKYLISKAGKIWLSRKIGKNIERDMEKGYWLNKPIYLESNTLKLTQSRLEKYIAKMEKIIETTCYYSHLQNTIRNIVFLNFDEIKEYIFITAIGNPKRADFLRKYQVLYKDYDSILYLTEILTRGSREKTLNLLFDDFINSFVETETQDKHLMKMAINFLRDTFISIFDFKESAIKSINNIIEIYNNNKEVINYLTKRQGEKNE